MLEVTVKRAEDVAAEESQALDEASRLAYAGDGAEDLCWSDSQWFVLGKLDGRVVSLVGILERTILVGDREVLVGGVGGVATHPEYQRRGYAGELMRRTGDFMRDTLGLPYGLLNCSPHRVPFYGSFGWEEMTAPMYFHCRGQRMLMDGPVMILRISGEAWPKGDVDLRGGPW
jgi:GNAT superfamily N-acetyltransferase